MWRRRPSSARTASALSSSSSTDSPSRTSWRKLPSPQAILLFGLRALSCACVHIRKRWHPASVDTRPEADRLGGTDRVVEDHRSRVERWLCHAIEARVSISSRLLMMSNTSNRVLLNFFAGQCEPQSHAGGGGGGAVLCLQPFNNSTKTTQSCSQIDILICRAKLCLARRSRCVEKAAPQQPSWSKLRKKRGKGRGPSLVAKPSKPARG